MKTTTVIHHWILAVVALATLLAIAPHALAQDAAAATPAATAADATPWYLSPSLFSSVIALLTGAIAIWKNQQASTAQKVSASLVMAIEEASKIPAVADQEKKIKAKVQEVTERYDVGPVVAALVKKLT
ncbi:MAG: hypothetical protein LBK99_00715 [Opitutaceae bacterium]|jgi:hypothetical protein|nr:hypothetical protein [Opitutaceae bacterium]